MKLPIQYKHVLDGHEKVYFMAIDAAKFRKPVVPGDTVRIYVKKEQNRRNVWKFKCEAKVEDKVCAEATITAMIMDK